VFRKAALTTILLGGCVWVPALVTRADSAEPEKAATAFRPVASVHTLMEGQGMFFKKIGDALQDPQAPKRKKEIAFGAELLAELANVNTHNKDLADYVQWAGQLRDTAMELASEAQKKGDADEDKMNSLFSKLEATCKACHEKYQ
jgi:cytochrome c556